MKRLLALLVFLLLPLIALAQATRYTSGDWTYVLQEDGTAKIIICSLETPEVTLPATLDGHPVTALDSAFATRVSGSACINTLIIPNNVTTVTGIPFRNWNFRRGMAPECTFSAYVVAADHPTLATINGVLFSKADKTLIAYPPAREGSSYTVPEGILAIGDEAFYNCMNLKRITLPASLTTIGSDAFYGCKLESIDLPDSLTTIAAGAFHGCTGLNHIVVSENHPAFRVTDGQLYSTADSSLICVPPAYSGTRIGVAPGTQTVSSSAFQGCKNIVRIVLPDGLTSIGASAFRGCTGLKEVVLPPSLSIIEEYAFAECYTLTGVTLPDGLLSIPPYIFYDSGLQSIVIPDEVAVIGQAAFYTCDSLQSVSIPDSVITIGESAFSNCSQLSSLTLPSSLITIGKYAFSDCSGLTSLCIPASLTEISESAFNRCKGLLTVTLTDGVKTIGKYAFAGCTSLVTAIIPSSVTAIDDDAFKNCPATLCLTVVPGSFAEAWAQSNGISYSYTDPLDWLAQ